MAFRSEGRGGGLAGAGRGSAVRLTEESLPRQFVAEISESMNAGTFAAKLPAVGALLFGVAVLGTLAVILVTIIRRASKGQLNAPRPPTDAVFVERWASGRDLGSGRQSMGGARRCLFVALTKGRLITALQPPFNLFSRSDLEHDIPLGNVTGLTEAIGSWRGPSVRLRFRDPHGIGQEIELLLDDQRRFMDAWRSLEATKSAIAPPTLSDAGHEAVAMLPLPEALRRHWLTLAGVCLFPTFGFVGFELFGIRAAWAVVPLFFVTFLFALKPVGTRRVPLTFWLVVVGLWSASAFPAAILVQIIKWLRRS